MQEFNAIERIVRSGTRKSELVKHAERYLRAQAKSKSYAISELRKNWYYLQKAIQTVVEARTRSRDLPYAITKEYWRRKNSATDARPLVRRRGSYLKWNPPPESIGGIHEQENSVF